MLSLLGATLLLSTGAQAQTFGFEGLSTGTYTSFSETQGGLTATVTRTNGVTFDLTDIGSSAPGFGNRSLAPFNSPAFNPFVVDFSAAVGSVSVQLGDFAPSDADDFFLSVFSGAGGTGTLLGTVTASQSGTTGFPTFTTLSLTGASILSATFNGGSTAFPSSVFADNITVTPLGGAVVPEPASWALMIAGIGVAGGALRRRRSTVRTSVAFA